MKKRVLSLAVLTAVLSLCSQAVFADIAQPIVPGGSGGVIAIVLVVAVLIVAAVLIIRRMRRGK